MEETKEVKKLSYEELEKIAHELNNQCQKLYSELQKSNMINTFKRLDYLFKVLENKDVFNSDFITTCVNEIQEFMTIREENTSKED